MEAGTCLLLILNGIFLGTVLGFIMHRSDFCLAGMFRDMFLFRQFVMLRMLALAIILSAFLFEAARLSGLIRFYPFPLLGPASLATCIGGAIFGVGMVLAGGCVVGTLYKMGAGNLLSLTAFAGLIAGSTLYAEMHVIWAKFRNATTFGTSLTVSQIFGIEPSWLVIALLAGSAYPCYRWYRTGAFLRHSEAAGYLQPYKAAILIALIGLWSYSVTGMPLGITTAYAKMGAYIESIILKDHFQGLHFFRAPSPAYINPITDAKLQWSAGPLLDAVVAIQFPLIVGIAGGGMLSALLLRELKIYWRVPPRQYVSAALGGIIMGMASRMAPGCNVWHILGGLPILACQSLCFCVGLLPGAWMGSWILRRLVVK